MLGDAWYAPARTSVQTADGEALASCVCVCVSFSHGFHSATARVRHGVRSLVLVAHGLFFQTIDMIVYII